MFSLRKARRKHNKTKKLIAVIQAYSRLEKDALLLFYIPCVNPQCVMTKNSSLQWLNYAGYDIKKQTNNCKLPLSKSILTGCWAEMSFFLLEMVAKHKCTKHFCSFHKENSWRCKNDNCTSVFDMSKTCSLDNATEKHNLHTKVFLTSSKINASVSVCHAWKFRKRDCGRFANQKVIRLDMANTILHTCNRSVVYGFTYFQ